MISRATTLRPCSSRVFLSRVPRGVPRSCRSILRFSSYLFSRLRFYMFPTDSNADSRRDATRSTLRCRSTLSRRENLNTRLLLTIVRGENRAVATSESTDPAMGMARVQKVQATRRNWKSRGAAKLYRARKIVTQRCAERTLARRRSVNVRVRTVAGSHEEKGNGALTVGGVAVRSVLADWSRHRRASEGLHSR